MTYQVIARKWRPQTFADLVGQAHVTETLQNAIKNNRVAHAYIFSGARGVGKTTAARILEIFTGLARHHLTDRHGNHVQTFHPDVTELQALVLDLLDIPHSVYTT